MTERPYSLEPKTIFTFFPHNNEVADLANETTDELIEEIKLNKNLTVQFLHELWRTNREDDIYACLRNEEVQNLVRLTFISTEYAEKIAVSELYGEKRETSKKFLTEIFTLVINFFDNSLRERPLPDTLAKTVNISVDEVLVSVDTRIRAINSQRTRLN